MEVQQKYVLNSLKDEREELIERIQLITKTILDPTYHVMLFKTFGTQNRDVVVEYLNILGRQRKAMLDYKLALDDRISLHETGNLAYEDEWGEIL